MDVEAILTNVGREEGGRTLSEKKFCIFCDAEAVAVIFRSGAGLCASHLEAYEAGQSNPFGGIVYLSEVSGC